MIKVKKGNKIVQIQESALTSYLKNGFDQIDKKGEIVKRATGGKTISVAEYNKALIAINQLKKENENLKSVDEVKELRVENKKLEVKNKKLKAEIEKLKK